MKSNEFVYRLVTERQRNAARRDGVVAYTDVDERDGYFHLSTRDQLITTANLYFSAEERLFALVVPTNGVAEMLKFERVSGRQDEDFFPHLYGRLGTEKISHEIFA